MKDNKRQHVLFAAAMGLIAVVVTQVYISQQTRGLRPSDVIEVTVAKGPLQEGTPLTPHDLEKKKVPRANAPVSAIPFAEADDYVGQIITANVAPGDYILPAYFSVRRMMGQSLSEQVVGPDARAVTIPVNETSSLAGSVVAGDLIDIVFSFNVPGHDTEMAALLLQNVPVISVGAYRPDDSTSAFSARNDTGTLTLLVTAADALRLKYAMKQGSIDVLLRNRSDGNPLNTAPLTSVRDILGPDDQQRFDRVAAAAKADDANLDALKQQMLEQVRSSMHFSRPGFSGTVGGERK